MSVSNMWLKVNIGHDPYWKEFKCSLETKSYGRCMTHFWEDNGWNAVIHANGKRFRRNLDAETVVAARKETEAWANNL